MTSRDRDTEPPSGSAEETPAAGAEDTVGAPADEEGVLRLPKDAMIILPVRNAVLFPSVVMPLAIGRPGSIAAALTASRGEHELGVLLQRDPTTDNPAGKDLHPIGTASAVLRYVTTGDGSHHLIVQGLERFRVREFLPGYDFLVARVERLPVLSAKLTPALEVRMERLRELTLEALRLVPGAPQEMADALRNIDSASALADLVASTLDLPPGNKQEILETLDVGARLDRLLEILAERLEVLRLQQEISSKTTTTLSERQREHLLREQLQTIQQELGEADSKATELAELRDLVEQAGMPMEVREQADKELRRLERMHEASMEYSIIRGYLDWLIELPWREPAPPQIDIAAARSILDEDHYGLDRVKRRILEYLAVRKLKHGGRGPILCFVGPPGVGKTSLGQSIARAMGVGFVRASLGGLHDEAEIRGHRRTYVGALPGMIIQSIHKTRARNCVFMLDEMDKLGSGFRGDPSSALLEVLDPEQNNTFRDNYLSLPFDLSAVTFIATANVLDAIPGPLRDRMEVIELPGYTQEEKLAIAQRFLLARQLDANGLEAGQCSISDDAIRAIIRDYTREAGCRNLERELGAVCRNVAVRIAEGHATQIAVEAQDLAEILGPPRFESELKLRTSISGVATGLAWTAVGGDILFIEASRVPGKGRLILTGQLGDVMKESAQAALSLVKARADALHVDPRLFEKSDIHIHVPAGAIPKDGPSAGVTMFVALVSLLDGRTVHSGVAMTGEISLRGLVLPVGGIKEKVLAAARAGINTVLLPARNRKDLPDIPSHVRERLQFVWMEHVNDAIEAALSAAKDTASAQPVPLAE
jgi:ATP-dependent Lon protease